VTAPALLIAEREFRAYTTTASFWVALVLGPLVMAGVLAVTGASQGAPPPLAVAVRATEPAVASSARAALTEAAAIEGRRLDLAASAARADVELVRKADGDIEARFSSGFPLSASGRALVARTIERDEAVRKLATARVAWRPMAVVSALKPAAPLSADAGALTRFCLMMILWMTLTGSLGMLLQAVVRERANRALEGLLAAARPSEIVLGKLAGVGAVSFLVLVAWLGSASCLASVSSADAGLIQAVIAGLGAPLLLVRAVAIYVLAYAFYGLVTVAVGASARDSAAAQNLARPMFAVLLAAFFAAIAAISGSGGLDWLIYAPPFTPFMLLLRAPESLSATSQILAAGLTVLATVVAGRVAVSRVTLTGAEDRSRGEAPRVSTLNPADAV
jgi:ABC-2 type transport system permease protein